ncbi:MAG: AbrB/MazE/SpoVT family DNA-binding domain-containing protein [Sulfuricellaceae bacterium]
MATMTVSSEGQIVLPADIRRRLGFLTGSQVEVIEQPDGVRLVVSHPAKTTTIAASAGIVTAPSKGKPRRLEDFDPAMLMRKAGK